MFKKVFWTFVTMNQCICNKYQTSSSFEAKKDACLYRIVTNNESHFLIRSYLNDSVDNNLFVLNFTFPKIWKFKMVPWIDHKPPCIIFWNLPLAVEFWEKKQYVLAPHNQCKEYFLNDNRLKFCFALRVNFVFVRQVLKWCV